MATKIRLMRLGKIRTPYFRIVVIDSKKARNGLSIEEIGRYAPGNEPSLVEVNSERAQYWLKVGAQPSAAVTKLFKLTGDWAKFTGEGSTSSTVAPQPARFDKKANYEDAVKAAANEPAEGATTAKQKAQDKLAKKSEPVIVDEVAEVPAEPVTTEAVSEPTSAEAVAEVPQESATTDETPEEKPAE
ncbi:MAG: 30S ribosomal protein S16 [Candidatus Nanopelagicaceae bacterium]